MPAFLIFTGCDHGSAYAEIDQIVETLAIAKREATDLQRMGCGQIRIYEFADMAVAEEFADTCSGRFPNKTLAKLISTLNLRN